MTRNFNLIRNDSSSQCIILSIFGALILHMFSRGGFNLFSFL